ncbi:MAG: ABC transporter ATP-binding protein [Sulfolobales archaeon]|nr:ABC transporter ATP-binding protein [Sulfolobales archaeon]MCX8199517.1 ABC transporter ATP-binding protein [Sulfolobales archaeon]MDW8170470.1 ABC transporter ATP-binding protein [Desulfurococcaceae archaeon]
MKPLEISDLTVGYKTLRGWITALSNVNLSIDKKGEILALVGESGSGKSTLGLAVAGLLSPNARANGSIKINGKEALGKPYNSKVAVIFQDALASLNPVLTIGEQLAEIFVIHEKLDRRKAIEKAKKFLLKVGLSEEFLDKYPHELSGGQRQRALISMALAMDPELIIADEPTTALDVTVQAKVLLVLKNLVKSVGIPMIYITHDIALAMHIADSIAIMYAGQIIELSSKYDIFENPLHPYTKALLKSIPTIDSDVEELYVIEGEPPNPDSFPKGCRFHPRCPLASDKCKSKMPEAINVNGRSVRCHLYG